MQLSKIAQIMASSVPDDNVVVDSSFEASDITAAWNNSYNEIWNASTGKVRDNAYYKYGSYAAKCGVGNTNQRGAAEKGQGTSGHPVTPGETLIISFDKMATDAATTILLLLRCYDSSGNNISSTVTAPTGWTYNSLKQALADTTSITVSADSAWTRYSKSIVVPANTAYVAISIVYNTGGSLYYFWLDGVKISRFSNTY